MPGEMKIPLTTESENFSQVVLSGAKAKMHTLVLMFNTYEGSNQEDPDSGFNLDDFLFKTEGSEEFRTLKGVFDRKCKEVTGDPTIRTSINFIRTNIDLTAEVQIHVYIVEDDREYGFSLKRDVNKILSIDKVVVI